MRSEPTRSTLPADQTTCIDKMERWHGGDKDIQAVAILQNRLCHVQYFICPLSFCQQCSDSSIDPPECIHLPHGCRLAASWRITLALLLNHRLPRMTVQELDPTGAHPLRVPAPLPLVIDDVSNDTSSLGLIARLNIKCTVAHLFSGSRDKHRGRISHLH